MKGAYIDIVFFYCMGILAAFLYFNHFEQFVVTKYYYICFKVMEFLLIFGYSFFTSGLRKKICYCISAFFIVRVVWQVFELENKFYANRPYVVDILFGLCMLCILSIWITYKKNLPKNGRT